MKSVYFTCFLLFLSLNLVAQDWYQHFVGKGAKPSIAVDKYDVAHVAYMLEVGQGYLNHWQFEFDFYFEDTLSMGSFYGPLDIKTDSKGNAHIVYHDHITEELNHVYFTDFREFEVEPIPSPGHDGWDGSLSIDKMDQIHAASVDPLTGIEYAFYTGIAWSIEEIGTGALKYSNGTCIALRNDESPCISYYDDINQQLSLACKKDGIWIIENADPVEGSGRFSSLVFDKNDTPWISYFRDLGLGKGFVMLAHKGDNGWEHMKVDSITNVAIGRSGGSARNLTDLAIDTSDILHLSYCDQQALMYAKYDRNSILIDTLVKVEEGEFLLGQQSSIALTEKGNVYISYYDVEQLVPLSGSVWMITNDVISSTEEVIYRPEIKIWPNPAKEKIHFENDESRIVRVDLIDLAGNRLFSTETSDSSIPIFETMKSGLYIIQLQFVDRHYAQKILIQE